MLILANYNITRENKRTFISRLLKFSSALVKIYQWTGTAAFDPSTVHNSRNLEMTSQQELINKGNSCMSCRSIQKRLRWESSNTAT